MQKCPSKQALLLAQAKADACAGKTGCQGKRITQLLEASSDGHWAALLNADANGVVAKGRIGEKPEA